MSRSNMWEPLGTIVRINWLFHTEPLRDTSFVRTLNRSPVGRGSINISSHLYKNLRNTILMGRGSLNKPLHLLQNLENFLIRSGKSVGSYLRGTLYLHRFLHLCRKLSELTATSISYGGACGVLLSLVKLHKPQEQHRHLLRCELL